jgi:hypothetical protein
MTDSGYVDWLSRFLEAHGGTAGTIHVRDGGVLRLRASVNIPPKVQELTAQIPRGKGMAGLAWERNKPVQTCNLKTDTTGDVRPGAKAVDAKAAVALPVTDDGELWAVVGIAYHDDRELSDADLDVLSRAASELPRGEAG